jgi:hypothetical protein
MERILYNAVAALIEAENTSLIGLPRILKDEHYRASVLEQVKDPIVHGFFAEEYAAGMRTARAGRSRLLLSIRGGLG